MDNASDIVAAKSAALLIQGWESHNRLYDFATDNKNWQATLQNEGGFQRLWLVLQVVAWTTDWILQKRVAALER